MPAGSLLDIGRTLTTELDQRVVATPDPESSRRLHQLVQLRTSLTRRPSSR
jgi:hypothetical protein